MGESKGVVLGVELDVNCQTRVNLVISSGMARGFFTTMPTATGSVGEKSMKYYMIVLILSKNCLLYMK